MGQPKIEMITSGGVNADANVTFGEVVYHMYMEVAIKETTTAIA